MAKQLGQYFDFYLAGTSPAAPSTTANYTAVGEMVNVRIAQGRQAIEAANWDSGYDDDVLPGRRTRTLTGQAHFDVSADAGQEVALDAFDSVSGQVWFLLYPSSGVTGDVLRYGSGVVVRADEAYNTDGVVTLDLEIRVTSLTRGTRA